MSPLNCLHFEPLSSLHMCCIDIKFLEGLPCWYQLSEEIISGCMVCIILLRLHAILTYFICMQHVTNCLGIGNIYATPHIFDVISVFTSGVLLQLLLHDMAATNRCKYITHTSLKLPILNIVWEAYGVMCPRYPHPLSNTHFIVEHAFFLLYPRPTAVATRWLPRQMRAHYIQPRHWQMSYW
jgi:hypothetical protein